MPVSFNVGPSALYPEVKKYLTDAFTSGLLSTSHRAEGFTALYQRITELFRIKLHLPADYSLYFLSSATECWDVLARSGTASSSLHYVSGSFAQRWYEVAKNYHPASEVVSFLPSEEWATVLQRGKNHELVCITQNETSNGSQLPTPYLQELQERFPQALLAMDVTSSLAGIQLPFSTADVWYASVQKCFGLPSGLAVLCCSPRAVDRFAKLGLAAYYNSLVNVAKFAAKWQTTHTPNLLDIYLLSRVLEQVPDIGAVHAETERRARTWYDFFSRFATVQPLVENGENRSLTVIALQAQPELIARLKKQAAAQGYLLASGYGPIQDTTLRIANFPAIKARDIAGLRRFFTSALTE